MRSSCVICKCTAWFRSLTQSDLQNFDELKQALEECDQENGIIKLSDERQTYLFPDGKVWRYSQTEVTVKTGTIYTEAIFSEVTEQYEKHQELKRQTEQLKKISRDLKQLSDNVQKLTKEREVLAAKTKLHDQMGAGLIAIRQILRQNTTSKENAAAVTQFRRAIQILQEENAYPQDDVAEFIRDAAVSGIHVEITGELPQEEELLHLLLPVMREACVNAARHADASALYVTAEQTEDAVILHIGNDGKQPEGEIVPQRRSCRSQKIYYGSRRQYGNSVAACIYADSYPAGRKTGEESGGAGMTRVLIIDDQRIAREYMESVVKNGEDYELVGSLSQADLAATVCRRSAVDLVLMDVCTYGTKDGIDAAAELRGMFPKLKIIVVTSMVEQSFISRAKKAGVDSFWYKDVSPEDLITVMDTTAQGGHMWPDETPSVKLGVTTSDDFTETEIKVLRLVCEGLEYSEIAERLNYTKDNVKYHIRNILQKTGYANKTQLAIAVTGKRFIIPKLFNELDGSDENPIVL